MKLFYKKEIYHDALCKRLDEWIDGWRNVDLDGDWGAGDRTAGDRD
jgi:hypothetical protein